MTTCTNSIVEALNVNVYGNGSQTLVLAHGYGLDQTVWYYILPYLACYFKVVLFDLAFSANVNKKVYDPKRYSDISAYSEDLICVIDQLNINNTIYLGHSMSAMIGCIAATKRPELFQHLILLNGSPRYLNAKGYKGGFERSDIDAIFTGISKNFSSWVQSFAPVGVGVSNTTAITQFEYSLERMKVSTALSVARTVFQSDLREALTLVHVHCTIMQCARDRIVPKSVPYYMKKKLGASSRVIILPTTGHLPQLTAYPLLLKALMKIM